MRTPRNENLILQASDGHRRTVGSVICKHGTSYYKFWVRAAHERRDNHALGVNEAILRHLDDCGVRQIYLWDEAAKRIYGTTVQTLRRLGTRNRHTERVKGAAGKSRNWGTNLNLPIERWDRVQWFNLGYVPHGSEWVIEAVPAREDEPAEQVARLLGTNGHRSDRDQAAQLGLFDRTRVA